MSRDVESDSYCNRHRQMFAMLLRLRCMGCDLYSQISTTSSSVSLSLFLLPLSYSPLYLSRPPLLSILPLFVRFSLIFVPVLSQALSYSLPPALFLPLSSSRSLPHRSLLPSLSSSLSLSLSLSLPLFLSSLSLSSLLPRLPHFFSFLIFVLALAVYVDEREREEGKSARIAICITFLKTHHQNVNRNSNLY